MILLRNMFLMLLAYFLVTILTPICLPFFVVYYSFKKVGVADYFYTIAIGFDQAGGSVLYNEEDWTISGYTYYLAVCKKNKIAKLFMYFINFLFGRDHCRKAFEREKKHLKWSDSDA